jgi:hypothetical protein
MKPKNDKILTIAIVLLSVAGLLYFGLSAILDERRDTGENPFEYELGVFKESGADKLAYSEVKTVVLKMDAPHAIAIDTADRLYVSGDRQLVRFDHGFTQELSVQLDHDSYALAVQNDIYSADHTHITVLDSLGAKKTMGPSLGENAFLTSISVSGDNVFAADAGQLIVWRLDQKGAVIGRIGERDDDKDIPGFLIPSPYFDVLIDPDGFLWAVNTGRHQFENYTNDGGLRSSWAKTSMNVEGFSGCCNPSHAAFLADGSFVTAEKGLVRVKVHNPIGEFVSLVAAPDQFDEGSIGLDLAVDSQQRIYVLDPKRKQVRIFEKVAEASR